MNSNKKPYAQPKLNVYGEVEVLTKGHSDGENLDKDFPTGTPRGELTFS
ncbi:MAG: hypothetical protein KME21_01900 [Desmonostoc vinosum HA7617-LM4]|jgi:hypothetical protein|nr:hypothetical protein [Desmonostoc vinosum HA7617-LM4]